MKKMRTSPWIPALAMALPLLPQSLASQSVPVVTWQGEIRPRAEQRKPVEGGWESFVSMRTRIAADVRMEGGLGLFFQLQDVRTWGEESMRCVRHWEFNGGGCSDIPSGAWSPWNMRCVTHRTYPILY